MRHRFLAPLRAFATRSGLLGLCVLCGIVAEVYVLAVHAPLRVQALGAHRATLPDFGTGLPVRQTFRATANGLERLDLLFSAADAAHESIAWALLEGSGTSWQLRAAGRCQVETRAGRFWQAIAFPPVADSARRGYAIELRLTRANVAQPSSRIAPVLTFDRALPDGYAAIGGRAHPGDLVFRAVAQGDTVAGRFAMSVVPGLRRPFNRMAAWWLLVAILDALVTVVAASILRPA